MPLPRTTSFTVHVRLNRPFFVAGKTCHISMFLATSVNPQVADNLSVMAAQCGDPPVIWTIKVHTRCQAQLL